MHQYLLSADGEDIRELATRLEGVNPLEDEAPDRDVQDGSGPQHQDLPRGVVCQGKTRARRAQSAHQVDSEYRFN